MCTAGTQSQTRADKKGVVAVIACGRAGDEMNVYPGYTKPHLVWTEQWLPKPRPHRRGTASPSIWEKKTGQSRVTKTKGLTAPLLIKVARTVTLRDAFNNLGLTQVGGAETTTRTHTTTKGTFRWLRKTFHNDKKEYVLISSSGHYY
jgi:hypothetical protein